MANILDFLRGLMTNGREQEQFGVGPEEYLASHGYADLSGEDVTEAMRVLTPALPADVGSKLSCYVDDDGSLPSVRPQMDETELDAAVRQLRFAVALAATAVDEQAGTATDGPQGLDSAADAPMSEAPDRATRRRRR